MVVVFVLSFHLNKFLTIYYHFQSFAYTITGCDIHSKMSVSITFRFSSLVIKKATTVYTPPLIKGYIDSKRQSNYFIYYSIP